jgi:two-component sensor histidine kinase
MPDGTAKDVKLTVGIIQGAEGRPHALAHFLQEAVPVAALPLAVAAAVPASSVAAAAPVTIRQWVPLLRTDSLGKIEHWEDSVGLPLMGLSADEMLGRWLHQLFRPSDATGFYTELQGFLAENDGQLVAWTWYGGGASGETEFKVCALPEGCSAIELSVLADAPVSAAAAAPAVASQVFVIESGQPEVWAAAQPKREHLLLTETHHRIKNHLQIISSLLNLEGNSTQHDGVRNVLRSSQNRVRAIAALHQHLLQAQLGQALDFRGFVVELVDRLREVYEVPASRVAVHVNLDHLPAREEWLMPLALVVNEAISNALEHGYPGEASGNIWVSLTAEEDGAHLRVQDDGVGLPDGFGSPSTMGLGLKVLGIFSDQLKGQVILKNIVNGGVLFDLHFPMTCVDI